MITNICEAQAQVVTADRTRLEGIEKDRRLIAEVVRGNRNAQQEFVLRYRRLIYAVLGRYALTAEEREDLFQQVFVHLWERRFLRIQQWQPDGSGRFSSFLCVVVARIAVDYFRSKRQAALSATTILSLEEGDFGDLASAMPGPYEQSCAAEQRRIIGQALLRLSQRDGDLLRCRYYRGQSYTEIAGVLGLTAGHVGVALQRAQARLRRELCREHAELFSTAYVGSQDSRAAGRASATRAGKPQACTI